jgi:hypothetical protein
MLLKKISKSLLLGAVALLMIGTQAQAGITLGYPGYGGNGCPQGTASATLSPDGRALTVIFDQFIAQAGKNMGNTIDRKACNISIPVNIPNGYSISIVGVDYRGFNALPVNSWSRFSVEYFFAGSQGPSYSQTFRGPLNQNYLINNKLALSALVWSPCGQSVNLRVNSNMMVSNSTYNDAMATVDSADFKAGLVYHFQMRSCH